MEPTNNTLGDMTALDPFSLRDLVQDTNRRIFGIIVHDYEKVVPETALGIVKDKLREAAAALGVEMMNDVQDLQGRLGITDVMNHGRHLPDPKIMAEGIAEIFAPPPQDPEALRRWAVRRFQWAFDVWLHLNASLMRRVASETPVAVAMAVGVGANASHVRVPKPQELEAFGTGWGLIERATGEYLQAKGDLLRAYGTSAPHINIIFDRGKNRAMKDAMDALWSDQEFTPHLVLRALRHTLLEALQLNHGSTAHMDIRLLLTSGIVGIAKMSGLTIPFDLELLGNLAAELERYESRCVTPPICFLFPCARILMSATESIATSPINAAVAARAADTLLRSTRSDTAAAGSGDEQSNNE